MKRMIIVLLVIGMIGACFTSCGNANQGSEESNVSSEFNTEHETDPVMERLEEVKEKADWKGQDFGILYVNNIAGYTEEFEAVANTNDASGSGVINDAVYERNKLFEEYCHLNMVLIPKSNSAINGQLLNEIKTMTGDFHLVMQTAADTATAATSGYLFDYLKLDIDYEQEWWDQGMLDFSLKGHIYLMNGPFNIVDDDVTYVMMFNKKLQTEHHIENLYETVQNKQWTLSYFNSLVSDFSSDNGDGVWDDKDTYGFTSPSTVGVSFFYGAGLRMVDNSRTMETPKLMLDDKMEIALNVLDISRAVIHDNNSSYVTGSGQESTSAEIFTSGRALFYSEVASYLRSMTANMEDDYGVLPIPKYSEEQEKYCTWSNSIGSTLSIPSTVAKQDVENFAVVLEVFVLLSQKYVRPAYYDVVLLTRNVDDVESSEILDMIFQNRTYDMALYYSLGLSNVFSNAVMSRGSDFSSQYAAANKSFDRTIINLLRRIPD